LIPDLRLNIAPFSQPIAPQFATQRLLSPPLINTGLQAGAYPRTGTSRFNGFSQPPVIAREQFEVDIRLRSCHESTRVQLGATPNLNPKKL